TILTFEDNEHDYSTSRTYGMVQEVFDLSDRVEEPIPPGHIHDELIISTVADQMAMAGYTRVDVATGNPDVLVMLGAVAQRNWAYYSWGGCWGYYSYYCYYPPYVVPVSYDVGTLIMTMIDPNEMLTPPEGITDPAVPVIWTGAINGLLETSVPNTARRIEISIAQAFEQSPFLVVGAPVDSQPTPPAPVTP
ncbi:MAG: hypothetical protein DRJ42_13465, partial [Deltaproteobacteria bacterium]